MDSHAWGFGGSRVSIGQVGDSMDLHETTDEIYNPRESNTNPKPKPIDLREARLGLSRGFARSLCLADLAGLLNLLDGSRISTENSMRTAWSSMELHGKNAAMSSTPSEIDQPKGWSIVYPELVNPPQCSSNAAARSFWGRITPSITLSVRGRTTTPTIFHWALSKSMKKKREKRDERTCYYQTFHETTNPSSPDRGDRTRSTKT